MTAVRYIPGTWLGIVRSHTAVLLEPDTKPALIAALWGLLESRPEVHEVLHAVTSSSGGSLANIPFTDTQAYIALTAFVLNLIVVVVLTFVFRAL